MPVSPASSDLPAPAQAPPNLAVPDLSAQPLRFLHAYWRVWQALAAHAEGQLSREHGLDLRAFIALSYLQSGVTGPGDLAVQLGLPRYVITRTLDTLVRLGAVERGTDPHDARRQTLLVTQAGHALWAAALRTVEQVCAGPLGGLGEALTPLTVALEQLADVRLNPSRQHPSPQHPAPQHPSSQETLT